MPVVISSADFQIRNGSGPTSPLAAKYCGWMLPPPVFASSNSVWLNFVTDTSVTYPGYDITYTATTQGELCVFALSNLSLFDVFLSSYLTLAFSPVKTLIFKVYKVSDMIIDKSLFFTARIVPFICFIWFTGTRHQVSNLCRDMLSIFHYE